MADGAIPQAKVNGLVAAFTAVYSAISSAISAAVAALTPASIGAVATSDSRLTDTRTPTDASVTNAKVAVGAAISADQLADGSTHVVMTAAERSALAGKLATSLAMAIDNQPANAIDIFPRTALNASNSRSSGYLYLSCFTAPVSMTINAITMMDGSTAAAGLTLARMGIYSFDETTAVLLGATANDTTLFTTVNTSYTRNLTAPVSLTAGTRYAVGSLCIGTTMPTIAGINSTAVPDFLVALTPKIGLMVGGQTDLPASISGLSISQRNNYARVS